MFWTSPELLDIQPYFRRGSPKADAYAYGVILYEILYRKAPYDTTIYSPIGMTLFNQKYANLLK